MAESKCTRQYFQNLSDVSFSLNWCTFFIETSYNFKSEKPWIPIAVLNPTANYQIDFTSSVANPSLAKDIMEDCLTASYNFIADSLLDPKYTDGQYAAYLAQRIGVKATEERYSRYKMIYNTIVQFWTNFVTSGDYMTDVAQLQKLMDFIKINTDKRYWIAPGSYHVSGTNPSNVTMDAINAANPLYLGNIPVLIIELDSIG
jgi:hypothetical protein